MRLNKTTIAAFLSVYIIWGSTYLAILYAIETLPAWGLTSGRNFVAAAIMFLISILVKESKLQANEKKIALVSGIFLMIANGIVCVVEKWVPSGIAAVIIGAMPIWVMMLNWILFAKIKPEAQKMTGAMIGVVGIALIAFDQVNPLNIGIARFGFLILCGSSILWATGTLMAKKARAVKSGFRFATLQMFSGALATGLISLMFEKPWAIDWTQVSDRSWLAFWYLAIFGSVIAFTAFSWISRNAEPHLVATYALVNPLIAVALGWFFYNEVVTMKFALATVLVLIGLSLLIFNGKFKYLKLRTKT